MITSHAGGHRRVAAALKGLAVAGAVALGLVGCSSGSSSASSEGAASYGDLNVQLSWILNEEFAGEYFATQNGYFTDAGFSTVNLIPGPSTGAAELVSGSADVALSDAMSIAAAIQNEQAPLKIIGATYQKNPFTILSLKDGANIQEPSDMIGKKIGVQDSNTSLFNALLAANGISQDEVTVVPVQYDPKVLEDGEVDGWVGYVTNEEITVKNDGYDVQSMPYADAGLPFVAETVTVTDDSIANNREMLKAFLKAEIQGWTDNVNDPEAGALLAVNDFGKDQNLDEDSSIEGNTAQVNDLVTSDETKENGLFTISDSLQDETIASLAAGGISVTKDQLFDMSLLDEVYQENPDLKSYEK